MTPAEVTTTLRRFSEWRLTEDEALIFEIGEAIDVAVEMIERLELAEKERDALRAEIETAENDAAHQKALAASALRVAEGWERKCGELRAKIEAMEKQKPVAQVGVHKTGGNAGITWSARPLNEFDSLPLLRDGDRLYLAPGAQAQPAPSIPEGWKLVPIEPTEKMISEGSCASSLPGPHYISEGCAQQCWKYMIAAAPEAKP